MSDSPEIRTLPAFTRSDVQLLFYVSISFSFAGGILQELHRAAGPSALQLILSQVFSNLFVSITTVLIAITSVIFLDWNKSRLRLGARIRFAWLQPRTVPMASALLGGMLGGLLGGLVTRDRIDLVLIITSGLWMIMANLLVRIIGNASRRIWLQAQDLQNTIDDLQASRIQLIEADVAVRKSIAEYLHGSVQSELIDIEHQASLVHASDVANRIRNFRSSTIRNISHQLHPMVIDVGLMPAIDDLIGKSPLMVNLHISQEAIALDDFGNAELEMRTRMAIYRVIQEGLLNASTAAGATHVNVTLEVVDGCIRVEVTDDGCGPTDNPIFGIGFQSIDAWVRGLGGEWCLIPNPEGGAKLTADIPLDRYVPTH